MRRRRRAKDRLCRDAEATAKRGFKNRDSFVAHDGRVVLYGVDAADAYERAYLLWDGNCGLCGLPVRFGDAERHHIRSKGRHLRDDRDENQVFVHRRCHREKHNREVQWTRKAVAEIAGGLNT